LNKTSASLGKSSASSGKKVTIQNLSEKGSSLFVNPSASELYDFLPMTLIMEFFQNLKIFVHNRRPDLRSTKKIMLLNPPCLEKLLLNDLLNKRRSTSSYLMSLNNLSATSTLLKLRIWTLRRRLPSWRKPLGSAKMVRRSPKRLLNSLRRIWRNCRKLTTMI
jgi:hypothetical protein